jgi:hypothetical protein
VKQRRHGKYYAIYRGDTLLAHGTTQQMAWLFNMREKSLRELSRPSYYARLRKSKNPDEWLVAELVEELTSEDLEIKHRRRKPCI